MDDVRQAVLMTEIASSDRLWTRAAVRGGRIFVCFPRWFADQHMRMSVGELVSPGRVKPYPSIKWNSWERGDPRGDKFVCVQSVYFDDEGKLWVLDTANPTDLDSGGHGDVIGDGPRLYKFDVATSECSEAYSFSESSYRQGSYFNDVRICTERQLAFITDSGVGAIIVLDLMTGHSRRLLEGDDSVQAEKGFVLEINGQQWQQNGKAPEVHSDGIALSPDRKYLYYKALAGRTLYRIDINYLLSDPSPTGQVVGRTSATDGMQFGADGRLYLTNIEDSAITRLVHPYDLQGIDPDCEVEPVIKGVPWGDSITRAADGSLYVTTSLIHLQGDPKELPRGPFKLFRLQIGKLGFS